MADTSEDKPVKKGIASRKTLDAAAYTISAATAVGMADNTIKDTYYRKYKNAHDLPGIETARNARTKARQSIFNEGEPKNSWSMERAFKLRKEEMTYAEQIKETFHNTGMYNDLQFFTALDSTAKWRVFEKVATVSGVVLAASLALAGALSRDEDKGKNR